LLVVGCLLLIGMAEVPIDRNFGAIGLGLTLASELAEMNPWAILLCGAELENVAPNREHLHQENNVQSKGGLCDFSMNSWFILSLFYKHLD
jgi:hypothetical protein